MKNPTYYRPTMAKINLRAIQQNVQSLKTFLDEDVNIIAVVKADGYGHGEVEVARAVIEAGAQMIAVATPDEAVRLRANGIVGDILVMGPSPVSFAKMATSLNVIITVSNAGWLQSALEQSELFLSPLKIHVKIDSGMGRIGLRDEVALYDLIKVAQTSSAVMIDGVFTHFSCADEAGTKPTDIQFTQFMELVALLPTKPRLVHASNSAATLLYPNYALDAVRFGISLYGIAPSSYVGQYLPFPLKKAFTLESELAHVKCVGKGNAISYGATYETADNEWIGTIPIGYADGMRRNLRGQDVLIGGKRMPIVGTICMDQCMVKLSGEFQVGEKVVLIGRQGDEEITVEEWAERLDTIPYEIAVSITKRVPKIYNAVEM